MDHLQVEIGKVNKPAGLSMVEGLGGVEVSEVFVVGEDLYGEWGSMEVVSPGFQGLNDGKEFSVVDVVVSFYWGEQLGQVGAGVPLAMRVGLKEDHTRSIFGGISHNGKGGSKVWEVEYQFRQEEGFECIE